VNEATYHRALSARDRRFDGVFFVGVTTTGVYCRPVCPARTPRQDRCRYFARAAEAEREGFRACFRCRPELAPGQAAVDSVSRLVRAAVAKIEAGYLNDRSISELAASLGVSDRHLRRALERELGVTPVELVQTKRLALAKQLLHDTALPLTSVAFAAGFGSVRRFNALFAERFRCSPRALRRKGAPAAGGEGGLELRLDYRPPFDIEGVFDFLRPRVIPGVELIDGSTYLRSAVVDGVAGWVSVTPDEKRPSLRANVSLSLAPKLMQVAARLRSLFDLDARPDVVAADLARDEALRPLVKARPGLRVPGAFDGFELAVRGVLGQQVTVAGATTLCKRLVGRFGEPVTFEAPEGVGRIFPGAGRLAACDVGEVRAAVGLPEARARTIVTLARAVADERVDLSRGADPERAVAALLELPGIGPWTAQYLAMRALGWPDAFPAEDLVLSKALGGATAAAARKRAEAWRPWRAYAVMHLWNARREL
jgi:AraC family transcriptional regulator, regulatory protein of adaptative response / DNA-3-methyladenine glycosylase II